MWNGINIKRETINSLLLACLIEINMLCWLFENVQNIIIILTIVIMIVSFINNKGKLKFNKTNLLIFSLILIVFFINILFFSNNNYLINYFEYFIAFSIVAFLVTNSNFNISKTYNFLMLLGWIIVPYLLYKKAYLVDYSKNDFYGYLMAISYGLLPCFLASIFICLNKLYSKKIRILSMVLTLLITFMYLNMSSRGVIIAIAVYISLYIYLTKRDKTKKIVLSMCLLILVVFLVIFFQDILVLMKSPLQKIGIDSIFIDKTINLLNNGGISNGRVEIWNLAINDISSSPIFGLGIGSFEKTYSIGYVHNIFIQMIYEFGIILSFIMMAFVTKRIIKKANSIENKLFILYLFCAGVIQLFFSAVFWNSAIFWVFIGFISINMKNGTRKNGESR